MDPDFLTRRLLYRKGFINKNSPLYIDLEGYYKSADEIIKMIHGCGGLAFLAHPFNYVENMNDILQELANKIDGIECFHYSADSAQTEYLLEFCRKNGLLVSGGSDFHGDTKPHVKIGTGEGNHPLMPPEMLSPKLLKFNFY